MSAQPIELANALPSTASGATYLMCSPDFFEVAYVINPWMVGNLHSSSRGRAITQWKRLHSALSRIADVELIEPEFGSPDMVFTANAGLEHCGTVVLSRFFHAERRAEEQYFHCWLRESGYRVIELPREIYFEGEGDALFSSDGSCLWAGYGSRTSLSSHQYLAHAWNIEVASLHLVDSRFYHLDTCFAPLAEGYAMYYPGAFDVPSIAKIEAFYPPEKRIVVTEDDATRFACNAINIDHTIVLNVISDELTERLETAGFNVIVVPLSEFLKAGGAAKCLVLKLDDPPKFEELITQNQKVAIKSEHCLFSKT